MTPNSIILRPVESRKDDLNGQPLSSLSASLNPISSIINPSHRHYHSHRTRKLPEKPPLLPVILLFLVVFLIIYLFVDSMSHPSIYPSPKLTKEDFFYNKTSRKVELKRTNGNQALWWKTPDNETDDSGKITTSGSSGSSNPTAGITTGIEELNTASSTGTLPLAATDPSVTQQTSHEPDNLADEEASSEPVEFSVAYVDRLLNLHKYKRLRSYLKKWRSIPVNIPTKDDPIAIQKFFNSPFAGRIIVSTKLKIMYCPVPKAANSNWKMLIRRFEGFKDFRNLSIAHQRMKNGLRYLNDFTRTEALDLLQDPEYLKFIFVRSPFTRILSCYLNKFTKDSSHPEYQLFLKQLSFKLTERPSFPTFVDLVSKQSLSYMNEHWALQSYICGIGLFPYDFIGQFENIATEATWILNLISNHAVSFPSQDEIKFPSTHTNKRMHQYYNKDLITKVAQIYKQDFDVLKIYNPCPPEYCTDYQPHTTPP